MTAETMGAPRAGTRTSLGGLVRSTGVVAALRGLDFGLSFLVSVLLANRFGGSGQLDAFFLARRTTVGFADTIRKLVGQVALPPVMSALDRGQPLSVHVLPRWLGWFTLVFALVMAAGLVIPGTLISLFAPGFHGQRHDDAATMMAIMIPLLPLAVIASLLATILQARRRYWLSEGTSLLQRGLLVVVLAVLVPPLGILAGAWTMLASGVVGFLILLAGAWSIVRRPARLQDGPVERSVEAAPARGGGLLAAIVINVYFQATTLIDFGFASTTAHGGVASLEYGSRLVSLVPGLIMSSMSTVLAPELIHAVQQSDRAQVAVAIQRFQRIMLFAQAPVSVGMILGAPLMVGALFGHGSFGPDAVAAAAACTMGFAAAGVFLAPMSAITSAIYADPHAPCLRDLAIIAVAGTLVRAIGAAIAAPIWGAPGVAYAAAASTAITFAVAQGIAVGRFHHFELGPQIADLAQTALCAGIAALAGWALLTALPTPGGVIGQLALLSALGALIVVIHAAAATVLRVPEMAQVRGIVDRIVARRRARR